MTNLPNILKVWKFNFRLNVLIVTDSEFFFFLINELNWSSCTTWLASLGSFIPNWSNTDLIGVPVELLWYCNRGKCQSFMSGKEKQAKGKRLPWVAWFVLSVLSSLRAAFCNHCFVGALPAGRWSFEPGHFLPEIHGSAGSVQEFRGFFCTKDGISVSALHIPPSFHLMMNQ